VIRDWLSDGNCSWQKRVPNGNRLDHDQRAVLASCGIRTCSRVEPGFRQSAV
jgi:hypothetical protein